MIKTGILSLIIHRIQWLSIPLTHTPMYRLLAWGMSLVRTSSFLQVWSFRCLFFHSIQGTFSFIFLCIVVTMSTAILHQCTFLRWAISPVVDSKGLCAQNSDHTSFMALPFLISLSSHLFLLSRLDTNAGSSEPVFTAGAGSSNHLAWMRLNSRCSWVEV